MVQSELRFKCRGLPGAWRTFWIAALLTGFAGCGGDNSAPPPSETVGTLAYALTECRDTPDGFFERQELHVRHGDRDTVVFETPEVGPVTGIGRLCLALTRQRAGINSVAREAIQQIAVSPDGSTVAFEINTAFSMLPTLPLQLPTDQQGIFVVSTDGSPPRRLAPPSSQRSFAVLSASLVFQASLIQFSPDSRRLAVVDNGPDRNGHDANQLWIIDVATGTRMQITHLPPPTEPTNLPPGTPTIGFLFQDNRTIGFAAAGISGGAPPHSTKLFTVGTDGSDLREVDSPVATGGAISPIFVITGARPEAGALELPGNCGLGSTLEEIFLFDGGNVLQLTTFGRCDTGQLGATVVDVDEQRIYFSASANRPFVSTNPSESCQLFSIDRTGGDLRQLTTFSEIREGQSLGCLFTRGPGCAVALVTQDARSRRLIVYSNCDLLGTNVFGAQLFAMDPDGTGIEQLTDARGLVFEPDGTVLGELPGPQAYGPHQ